MLYKSKRKLGAVILILVFVFMLSISVSAAQDEISSWANDHVKSALFYEIAYPSYFTSFKEPVTREEFAMMAVQVYRVGKEAVLDIETGYTFNDIENATYKDEIQIASNLGIVEGYKGAFSPYREVSRQEMCVMIYRLLQILEPDEDYDSDLNYSFADVSDIASWALHEVNYVYNEKIMSGTGGNKISPKDPATREQCLVLLNRLMYEKGYIRSLTDEYIDNLDTNTCAIVIDSTNELDDYLRDRLLNMGKEIRFVPTQNIEETDVMTVLLRIIDDFDKIGYYYVPKVKDYSLNIKDSYYQLLVDYEMVDNSIKTVAEVLDKKDFKDELLNQVRSGQAEKAYDFISEDLATEVITKDPISKKSFFSNVLYDHPELNYVSYYNISITNKRMIVKFIYDLKETDTPYTESEIKTFNEVTLDFAKDFLKENVKVGMSQIEKEKAIHDYIVLNTKYYTGSEDNTKVYYEIGIIEDGVAVCQGYASLAKLLLNMIGIQAIGINGYGDSIPHAWVLLSIYGDYYHLDVTWNDPVPDKDGIIQYEYFNVNDDQILINHTFDQNYYTDANGTFANYYAYNNLHATDKNQAIDMIANLIKANETMISIRVDGISSMKDDEIIDIIKSAFSKLNVASSSYSYSFNKEMEVINIYDINVTY